jgi:type VI protein secretion system component Hcp
MSEEGRQQCYGRYRLDDVFVVSASVGPDRAVAVLQFRTMTVRHTTFNAGGGSTYVEKTITPGSFVPGQRFTTASAPEMGTTLFLRVGDIHGGSQNPLHREWCDATGLLFSVSGPGDPLDGSVGRPTLDPLVVGKLFDKASPGLLEALALQHVQREALVESCRVDHEGVMTCPLRILLDDATVASLDEAASGEEQLTLDYRRIRITLAGSGVPDFIWDVVAGR